MEELIKFLVYNISFSLAFIAGGIDAYVLSFETWHLNIVRAQHKDCCQSINFIVTLFYL